jgi:Carboxypeptidase regulatory-like domain
MRETAFFIALAFAASQSAAAHSGSISGVVVQSGTNIPIANVQIELSSVSTDNPTVSSAFRTLETVTDDSGRFAIRDLPAGRFRVHWQRDGYFPPDLSDTDNGVQIRIGRGIFLNVANDKAELRSPSANFTPVDLGMDEQLKNLTLALIPGGVISGRVQDSQGAPVAGGKITALTIGYDAGSAFLNEVCSVIADDRGDFRLFGLHPGSYYVRVEHQATMENSAPKLYSYFPGVPTANEARSVRVNAGTESGGTNFSVQPGAARIIGSLTFTPPSLGLGRERTDGDAPFPPIVTYFLVPSYEASVVDALPVWARTGVYSPPQKGFEILGVRSGHYEMYAVVESETPGGDFEYYAGRSTVIVGNGDVENISVVIGAETTVSGRILRKEGDGTFEKLSVSGRLQAGVFPEIEILESWDHVNPDGGFKIRTLPGARYDLTVEDLPKNIAVVDIRQKGASVFDEGIIADGAAPVEILLSGNTGSIDVSVMDSKQQPVRNATVALVPTTEHRKNHSLYRRAKFDAATSRYVTIDAIPPGEYMIFAWDNIPDDAEMNSGFLREFESRGIRVVVESRKTIHVQLPLIVTQDTAAR